MFVSKIIGLAKVFPLRRRFWGLEAVGWFDLHVSRTQ